MTSSLPGPRGNCETFERFITTELTTVGAGQQPITWPLTPYFKPRAPRASTSRPASAIRRRRTTPGAIPASPCFSRTRRARASTAGSGSSSRGPPRSTRTISQANRERYFRESNEKLPGTSGMHPPEFVRKQIDWYYARIYIKVRPERVFVWPGGDISARSRRSTTPTSRRSAPATWRSRSRPRPRRPAASRSGTRGSTSSAARSRPRCCRGSGRTASRSRCRVPVAPDERRAAGADRRRPGGAAARRGRGVPDRPRARPRVHAGSATSRSAAASSPTATAGRSRRRRSSAASRCRRASSAATAPSCREHWRFYKTARKRMKARG